MMRRLLALLLCWLLLIPPALALNMGGGAGGGAGDILVTGTPTTGQVAIWVDPTHIQGASSVGLNVVAPATPGTLAATAGANNVTLVTLKRATDTTPTGNFVVYQNAAATPLWTVDIAGILQVGNVPAGRITGGVTGAQMADNTVTMAKLADMATASVVGRTTPGTGDPEVVPFTTLWTLPKKLENTRLKKRVLSQADPTAPPNEITIDADSFDVVKIAELSQNTTFNPPTGTHDVGDLLFLEIFTTTQRTLTFSTATNGFIADANLALPTISNAGGLVKYLFEWNGSKWAFVSSSQTTTRGVLDDCYRSNGPTAEPGFRVCGGGIAGTIGTIHLPVDAVKFPTSDAAVVDGSETNVRLLFDNAVRKCAYWGPFRMNSDYASTPVFKLQYSMFNVTGAFGVAIDVQVVSAAASSGVDVNTKPYAAVNTCPNTPVPAVAGDFKEISCPLTINDSLAANKLTKIQVCRNVSHATDNAAGLMEALAASLEYTR